MLDDVVDKEAGPKPKLVAQSGGVGSAVRHIPQEELDAYMNGRLAGAPLDYCRTHLDSCDECRAELEDLRTFKASAVGLSQSSSLKRELDRRRRQKLLKTAASAAIAVVVVAAIAVVGWNRFGKAWVPTTSVAATVAHAPAVTQAPVSGAAPTSGQSIAAPQMSEPAPVRDTQSVGARPHSEAVAQGRSTPSAPPAATQTNTQPAGASHAIAQVRATAAAASTQVAGSVHQFAQARATAVALPEATQASTRGTSQPAATPASNSFALLGPFGDEIDDERPEFAWQPLAGATKYAIIIVDEGLRPIAHSRVKTTTWRPHKPLRRGRTYLWQVTAILKNGTKVIATGPTSQEARIHVSAPSGKLTSRATTKN